MVFSRKLADGVAIFMLYSPWETCLARITVQFSFGLSVAKSIIIHFRFQMMKISGMHYSITVTVKFCILVQ